MAQMTCLCAIYFFVIVMNGLFLVIKSIFKFNAITVLIKHYISLNNILYLKKDSIPLTHGNYADYLQKLELKFD